jgi:hypothetical protein
VRHALTWTNKIRPVTDISEQVDLDVAVRFADGTIEDDWELVRADMIFESEDAAKKYVFMKKLKGK